MKKGSRRTGREYALKVIYCMQDQEGTVTEVLDDFWKNFRFREDVLGEPFDEVNELPSPSERSFTEELVNGVAEHLEHIDTTIEKFSTNWALDRMARVDLSLLRLATYELLYRPEIPTRVVINEAIEIGKKFGTKDTAAFINGVLDQVSRQYRTSEQ